jgi:hypothetical protein
MCEVRITSVGELKGREGGQSSAGQATLSSGDGGWRGLCNECSAMSLMLASSCKICQACASHPQARMGCRATETKHDIDLRKDREEV